MDAMSINFNLVSLNIGERKADTVVLFTDHENLVYQRS